MSQSPPSYSPMRRRQSSDSQGESEDSPESQAVASADPVAHVSPQRLFQNAPAGDTQMEDTDGDEDDVPEPPCTSSVPTVAAAIEGVSEGMDGTDDEEEEDTMRDHENLPGIAVGSGANPFGIFASGVSVLQGRNDSSEDEEADETTQKTFEGVQSIAQQPSALTQGVAAMACREDSAQTQESSEEEEHQHKKRRTSLAAEQDEDDEDGEQDDVNDNLNSVSTAIVTHTRQSQSMDAQDDNEEEEDEEEEGEDDVAADSSTAIVPHTSQSLDQPMDAQEEDDEAEEEGNYEKDRALPASSTQVVLPDLSAQLVPSEVAPEAATPTQVVLSPVGDSWGVLPPEANNRWSVHGDFCSLEIAGQTLKLPRSVYDRLFCYQRQGVAWMWNLFQKSLGGILADEMGLGKTVQVAAFLACVKYSNQGSRFLVVVPPTLLEQWRRELISWSSDAGIAVHVMHGNTQERRAAIRGMVAKSGVMLISYGLTGNGIDHLKAASLSNAAALLPKKRKKKVKRGCRDDDSPSEAEEEENLHLVADDRNRPWDVVIVDEGHQIKNPSCLVGRALRKLVSKSRFLLTGTPLQNKLSDLWALMDFAQPGLLGNHATFERNFSEQIAKGSKRNATRFAVEVKDHLARELKRITAPHFLRRLKDEVQLGSGSIGSEDGPAPENLPSKTDVVLWLNLTNAQVELYNLFLGSETVRRATAGKNGMEALKAIAMLKKLCNNPLLCLPKDEFAEWRLRTVPSATATSPAPSQQQPTEKEGAVDQDDAFDDDATQPAVECQDFLARLRAMLPGSAEGAALLSCKLRVLAVLLPQLQKRGHRCLIFSHSTRMLDLIQACVLRVLGLKFLRIDGTIDPKDRDLKLTKFQAPDSRYFCMCLSSQVGGVGLTITGADRVILADPAWNPAMDAQAIDRVHRLGQRRDVVVYRLVGSGAIEDKMFRLQVFKRSLAKTAMEHESQIRFFTNKELKQLFDSPNINTSTQSLMSEQLGVEALEHEGLLSVVANDIGSTDDPDAMPFWQSSDVLGFSDYQRLFMYLEQTQKAEEEAEAKAKEYAEKLRSEEYKKDQVIDGKWRLHAYKENLSPQEQAAAPLTNG